MHASAQHWLFKQIRDENRAVVSKSAKSDASTREDSNIHVYGHGGDAVEKLFAR